MDWQFKSNKHKSCKHRQAEKIIDTMKHYQQSLSTLATAMTETEKQNIKFECKKFTINHRN